MKKKIEIPLCGHVKSNGTQCQSPAMSGSYYCYFHDRLHQRHKRYRNNEANQSYVHATSHIQLHALEDAESVQFAISLVVNALATGKLNPKCAQPLLQGLRLASLNLRRLSPAPAAHEVVRDVASEPDGVDRSCHYNSVSFDPNAENIAPSESGRESTARVTLVDDMLIKALPSGDAE
jgi:hypothetical protein